MRSSYLCLDDRRPWQTQNYNTSDLRMPTMATKFYAPCFEAQCCICKLTNNINPWWAWIAESTWLVMIIYFIYAKQYFRNPKEPTKDVQWALLPSNGRPFRFCWLLTCHHDYRRHTINLCQSLGIEPNKDDISLLSIHDNLSFNYWQPNIGDSDFSP